MPDGEHRSKRKDTLLRLPLGELASWQLVASCSACRTERILFVMELSKRFGIEARLVMLLPKLRCRQEGCGRPPSKVVLRNRYPQMPGPPIIEEVVAG